MDRRSIRALVVTATLCIIPSSHALAAPSVLTEWPTVGANASSSLWPAANVTDRDPNTVWSSDARANAGTPEWVMVSLASLSDVNFVRLGTRYIGQSAYAFPTNFGIYYWNGGRWALSVALDHYPRPNAPTVTIRLPEPVRAQHILVHASLLREDDQPGGNKYFQLSEVVAGFDPTQTVPADYVASKTSASSELWHSSGVLDGNPNSVWSSNIRATAASTEYLTYGWEPFLLSTNYVKLLPRYYQGVALGFPVDFTVYYSTGSSYGIAATVTNFPRPTGGWVTIPFKVPAYAKAVFIVATRLGVDDNNSFVFQLAEARLGYNPALHQQLAACPGMGTEVVVNDSMTLNPACDYSNVSYNLFAPDDTTLGRNIELDCNGATLRGPATSEHPDDGKWPAIGINATLLADGVQWKLPKAVVKNCTINGYYDAVKVAGTGGTEISRAFQVYRKEPPYDNWTQQERDFAVRFLTRTGRTNGAGTILLDDLRINAPRHEGLYLAGAAQGVTLARSKIIDAGGPAIYLGNCSGGNTIYDNEVRGTYDDAMRIDASAENLIAKNRFISRGVILFKNCGEGENGVLGGSRPQHSWGNVFDGNSFSGMQDGVSLSIAHRASADLHQQWTKNWWCSDDIYFTESTKPEEPSYRAYYYRDYAEETVVRNNEFKDGGRVVVQDNGTQILNNTFSGGTQGYSIEVGSRVRSASGSYSFYVPEPYYIRYRSKVSEPVVGTVLSGNVFPTTQYFPVLFKYGSKP